jgi:hypothetical protein
LPTRVGATIVDCQQETEATKIYDERALTGLQGTIAWTAITSIDEWKPASTFGVGANAQK